MIVTVLTSTEFCRLALSPGFIISRWSGHPICEILSHSTTKTNKENPVGISIIYCQFPDSAKFSSHDSVFAAVISANAMLHDCCLLFKNWPYIWFFCSLFPFWKHANQAQQKKISMCITSNKRYACGHRLTEVDEADRCPFYSRRSRACRFEGQTRKNKNFHTLNCLRCEGAGVSLGAALRTARQSIRRRVYH